MNVIEVNVVIHVMTHNIVNCCYCCAYMCIAEIESESKM